MTEIEDTRRIDRRRFLQMAGALSVGGIAAPAAGRAATVKTKARIVVAGAGAAGLATVNRLVARLDGAEITIVDPRKAHWYQPGFTLIGAGLKPADYSVSRTSDYMPQGVTWIEEGVAEFDPVGNKIVTTSGKAVPYDYLVVATGLRLDYDAISGMDVTRIGRDGLGSVYAGPEAAEATWMAMSRFADQGGVGLFGRPATEMKCAGAPLKYTFLTDDILRRRGNRGKAELVYTSQNKALFSVPIVSERCACSTRTGASRSPGIM